MNDDELIEELRQQPEDFVLSWYSDAMGPGQAWEGPWVDVMYEDRLAWVISSGLEDDDCKGDFIWPPDLVAMHLVDPDRTDDGLAGVMPLRVDRRPTPEQLEELSWAWAQTGPNAYWVGGPAWSAEEVNRAIEDWCIRKVGRPIQCRWDAEHALSPQMMRIKETMEAMASGLEPTYLVKPGANEGGEGLSVRVSEQVMELLMQEMVEDDE